MADMILVLVQDILMIILAICAVFGNGVILYAILSNHLVRKNPSLYLITTLAWVDFVFAVSIFPYLVFLLLGWGFTVNYPPLPMLILILPVIIALKVSQIIDCAIGVDRLIAIQWPITYKLRRQSMYALAAMIVGSLWAAFDATFMLVTNEFKPNPACAAAGCFMSSIYLSYSGFSNILIDSVILIITTFILIRIYTVNSQRRLRNDDSNNEFDMFYRANRAAAAVMICSSITILIPGCIQGIGIVFGFAALQQFGPFVALGLILKAAANPFIYGFRHHDIRAVFKFVNKSAPVAPIQRLRTTQMK